MPADTSQGAFDEVVDLYLQALGHVGTFPHRGLVDVLIRWDQQVCSGGTDADHGRTREANS